MQEADQIGDRVMAVLWMTERELLVHLVVVAPAVAALAHVPRALEVVDDVGGRALGDANRLRDIPEARRGVGGDHLEHVGVVRYEPEKMIPITGA